jgi:ribosome-binding factor A
MSKRTEQVGDSIQQILGEVIQYELKDPRVGFATVVGVQVSGDLQHARVRISVMGDEAQRQETMAGLERAKGFLRRRVAQELRHLRTTPELHFILDTSLDYSLHIDDVLRKVAEERKQNPPAIDSDTDRKEPG